MSQLSEILIIRNQAHMIKGAILTKAKTDTFKNLAQKAEYSTCQRGRLR